MQTLFFVIDRVLLTMANLKCNVVFFIWNYSAKINFCDYYIQIPNECSRTENVGQAIRTYICTFESNNKFDIALVMQLFIDGFHNSYRNEHYNVTFFKDKILHGEEQFHKNPAIKKGMTMKMKM